jgi:hypothetical protein
MPGGRGRRRRASASRSALGASRGDSPARKVLVLDAFVRGGRGVAYMGLDVEKVLLAIEELRRWQKRAEELRGPAAARAAPEEVARVRQQVSYYSGLLQDMKRRANPDSAPRIIARFQ